MVIVDPNLASDFMTGRIQHSSPPQSDQDQKMIQTNQKYSTKSNNPLKDSGNNG